MSLIEDAVDSIHSVLVTSDALDTVLIARDLPVIREYVFGEKMLEAIAETPMIYIFGDDSIIERWRPQSQTQPMWDATHAVNVGLLLEDLDSDTLRRNLYKYTRAMIEVIIDAYPFDEFFPRGRIQIRYAPMLARNSRFLGDAIISLRLQKVESR